MSTKVIYADATSLRLSGCKRRLYYNNVRGLRSPYEAIDLIWGKAFHIFAEHLYLNINNPSTGLLVAMNKANTYFKEASSKPTVEVDKFKQHLTGSYLVDVCMNFAERAPKDNILAINDVTTGLPLVEKKFAIPIYTDGEVTIMMAGTMDRIVKSSDGRPYILDYKTTSSWKQDEYLAAYELDPQLLTYAWALRWIYRFGKANNIYSDVIQALDEQANMTYGSIGGCIYGVFLSSSKPVTFKCSSVFSFNDDKLDWYESKIIEVAQDIVKAYKLGESSPQDGIIRGLCKGFRLCDYASLCKTDDEVTKEHLIHNNFRQTEYNPLKFGEL